MPIKGFCEKKQVFFAHKLLNLVTRSAPVSKAVLFLGTKECVNAFSE